MPEPIGEPVWAVDDMPLAEGAARVTSDPPPDHPIAILWLPSPETRSGWGSYPVWRPDPPTAPIGFLRPRRARTPGV